MTMTRILRHRNVPSLSAMPVLAALCAFAYAPVAMAADHAKHGAPKADHPATVVAEPARIASTTPGDATVTEVRVERAVPGREKHPTLRFFKANRDFLRARFDQLRAHPAGHGGDAEAVDPRFLAYRKLIAEASTAGDSLTAADENEKRRQLFESVTELGMLESQLDQMDRLLAEQRRRLAILQADFAGRQRTTLAVVVSGLPAGEAVSSIGLKFEGGDSLTIPLSAEQRQSLLKGGILEVFHGLVEPREQVFQVVLGGDDHAAASSGWLTLDPARDRLTYLRLDLSPVHAAEGASSLVASTWVLDANSGSSDGTEKQP